MNHTVVDVSSDEKDDDKRVDYSDLFEGVLEVSDENPKGTDLFNPMVKNEDSDDDCVILDCDPTATAKETAIETCDTDEVLVIGQKGEIACRDFPHPRHACAKYPFNSTLHQQFCEMCHCYVCDTRAPCPYWFSGFSVLDHCHANDKEQSWKNQRECSRTRNRLPRPVSQPTSTILQFNRVSQPRSILLPQNPSTPVTQFGNQAWSTAIRFATHPKPLPQNSSTPVTQFGIQACSAAIRGATHPKPLPRNSSTPVTHFGIQACSTAIRGATHPKPLPQNSSTPVTHFGIQACSTAIRGATHPITYTRPGYRTGPSRTFLHNPGSQPRGVQLSPNNRGASYNGNPRPQAVPSNPFEWTRRPSRGVSRPENGIQNIAQCPQATCYTPPAASQGNAQRQRIVSGYISTVPVSPSKEYTRQFNRNMYSGNLQTNEVPSMTPNPPVNQQQQQSGRSHDKVLSDIEDWLLDDSTLLCPLSDEDNATTVAFDFETFLND